MTSPTPSPAPRTEVERLILAALADPAQEPLLAAAAERAATTRDRQLVALAVAKAVGDIDLLDSLARDHLLDYPDSLLAAWMARTPSVTHHQKDRP